MATKVVDQVVTPFDVSGGVDENGKLLPVDYDKITRDFGATRITPDILERFEQVTGHRPHRFMRRNIVFSHRDLKMILDRYEKGEPFYLYTGRGPSSDSMHVGHAIPFEFTRWLQEVFDCPLVIQLTDDEKFMHSQKIKTVEEVERYAVLNAKDIIGLGFDSKKTFIFSDVDYISSSKAFYKNVISMAKRITFNQIRGTFGFNESNNVGEIFFCAIQSAPSFATSFPHIFGDAETKVRNIPCLIPCAIDQDPYFRQCRDNAEQMKFKKPALIHSVFLPALQGPGSKMSASIDSSAIFLTDTPNQIKNKINRHAFSGGQDTAEKQRQLGGDPEVDVPFQYLKFFMEDDDELERLRVGYRNGEIMTGEMKAICIKYIQDFVASFQERRKQVTDEVKDEFFGRRTLEFKGQPATLMVEIAEKNAAKAKAEAKAKPDGKAKQDSTAEAKAKTETKEKQNSAAEAKPAENKGHAKSLSVGRSKVEIVETQEKTANGETKGHVKRMSMNKSS